MSNQFLSQQSLFRRNLFVLDDGKSHVSYPQCQNIVSRHRFWLEEQIQSLILLLSTTTRTRPKPSSTLPQNLAETGDNRKSKYTGGNNDVLAGVEEDSDSTANVAVDDVVIAFLSDNSVDFLMSLLACLDLSQIDFDVCRGKGETKTATITAMDNYSVKSILPAMLNSRWTPTEIAQALMPASSDQTVCSPPPPSPQHCAFDSLKQINNDKYEQQAGRKVNHATIILCDRHHRRIASEAVNLMNETSASNGHMATALEIPCFSKYEIFRSDDLSMKAKSKLNILYEHPASAQHTRSDKTALILFTSGTSSSRGAKGVMLSYRSLFIQSFAKTCPPCSYDYDTVMLATTVPWFHVGGITSALGIMLAGGCLIFPRRQEGNNRDHSEEAKTRFQPELVLQSLLRNKHVMSSDIPAVNTLVVVPAMLHSMVQHAQKNNIEIRMPLSLNLTLYPNVRLLLVGGQSIGKNSRLYQQTKQLFPNATIVQTYACTEAGSSITFEKLFDPDHAEYSNSSAGLTDTVADTYQPQNLSSNPVTNKARMNRSMHTAAECVGVPPPHIEIGIFPMNKLQKEPPLVSGQRSITPIGPGVVGIIGTRGPHTMNGYWNRSLSNSQNNEISHDRGNNKYSWMLTNDLGYIQTCDHNHMTNNNLGTNNKSNAINTRNYPSVLFFCGRANDVIRTGGESVMAIEVERILNIHEDVMECAVFALPHPKYGEVVCAAVVLRHNGASDESTDTKNAAKKMEKKNEQRRFWTKDVRKHCARHQLAGYKRPKKVFVINSLPKNSSGKILKHELVKSFANENDDDNSIDHNFRFIGYDGEKKNEIRSRL